MPKSLLFSKTSPHKASKICGAGRQEARATFQKDGRDYTMTLRDKVVIEDPYLVMVKATAFAIREAEPYMGRPAPRALRDALLKNPVKV